MLEMTENPSGRKEEEWFVAIRYFRSHKGISTADGNTSIYHTVLLRNIPWCECKDSLDVMRGQTMRNKTPVLPRRMVTGTKIIG